MLLSGGKECQESRFQFHHDSTESTFAPATNAQIHHQMDKLPQESVLLDNPSTVDVFSNPRLLRNIRVTPRTMTINCNAGVTHTNMIGEMPGYPSVVCFARSAANRIAVFCLAENARRPTCPTTQPSKLSGQCAHQAHMCQM